MSVYSDYALVSGVRIYWRSTIRTWEDWPADVRETLRGWNRRRLLTFANESYWGSLGTGFPAFTTKCVDCERFFNSAGSTACLYDGCWTCDDCMISHART